MSRFDLFVERVSDRLAPILVKEVRQGLRTRAFVGSFSVLLAGCVLVSLIAGSIGPHRDVGVGAFAAYLGCFALVGFVGLPMRAHRLFVRERETDTWPLLIMTGLQPRAVLRGKIASSLVQGALYASAVAPFLFFSYFLQGVPLVAIVGVIAMSLVWQGFLSTLAVSAAAFADGKVAKPIASSLFGIFLVVANLMILSTLVSLFSMARFGGGAPDLAGGVLISAWFLVSLGVLVFEAAASSLTSAGVNDAKGHRIAALIQVVGTCAGFQILSSQPDANEAAVAVMVYGSIFTFAYGLFAATGEDGVARALRTKLTRRHPLLPGALRGWRWTLLMHLIFFVTSMLLAMRSSMSSHSMENLIAGAAVAPLMLALALTLGRGVFAESLGAPFALRILAVALAAILLVTTPFTEAYELLDAPAAVVPITLILLFITDRVLASRESAAEAAQDRAREAA